MIQTFKKICFGVYVWNLSYREHAMPLIQSVSKTERVIDVNIANAINKIKTLEQQALC